MAIVKHRLQTQAQPQTKIFNCVEKALDSIEGETENCFLAFKDGTNTYSSYRTHKTKPMTYGNFLGMINFQIKGRGEKDSFSGLVNEDLLEIVRHRLQAQSEALGYIEKALKLYCSTQRF